MEKQARSYETGGKRERWSRVLRCLMGASWFLSNPSQGQEEGQGSLYEPMLENSHWQNHLKIHDRLE